MNGWQVATFVVQSVNLLLMIGILVMLLWTNRIRNRRD